MACIQDHIGLEDLAGHDQLYRANILRKLLAYAESWRRTLHQERFGIPMVRTLIITTSAARAEAMRAAAQEYLVADRRVPDGVFLFSSHEDGKDPPDNRAPNDWWTGRNPRLTGYIGLEQRGSQ